MIGLNQFVEADKGLILLVVNGKICQSLKIEVK